MRLVLIFAMLTTLWGCKETTVKNSFEDKNTATKEKEFVEVSKPAPEVDITPINEPIIPSPPILAGGAGGSGSSHRGENIINDAQVHFAPNLYEFWVNPSYATTHLLKGCTGDDCECSPGEPDCEALPAFANILLESDNFVWCKGGPFALCYYSGPSSGSTDLSCTLSEDGRFADCKCFEIPWGVFMVDINSILNYGVYQKTVEVCGPDGSACSGSANINKAPVCRAINTNNLIPKAELISAFSFDCIPTNGIGQTNCETNLYAGCMTAPCKYTDTEGIVECSCPVFNGPYQVGTALDNPQEECTLDDGLVWSAAFSPSSSTIPPTDPCIPDAPGSAGCPLYDANTMTLPPETDCEIICEAYACVNNQGIEPAYTCDASLCTGQCDERALLKGACEDLSDCPALGIAAIARLESEVECSCCASQLCGCQPNAYTNAAIYDLNQRQRDLSITPQCDINATLCGAPLPK